MELKMQYQKMDLRNAELEKDNKEMRLMYANSIKTAENYKKVLEEVKLLKKENLRLQNTIKRVSSRGGSQPRHKLATPTVQDVQLGKYKNLGKWNITFYTPCASECGNNEGITSSGKPVSAGYSVAVDLKKWKFGTKFYVEGFGIVVVRDSGRLS